MEGGRADLAKTVVTTMQPEYRAKSEKACLDAVALLSGITAGAEGKGMARVGSSS